MATGAGNGPGGKGRGTATPRRGLPSSRHGAITRDLARFASYQLWAEQVRDAWHDEADAMPPAGTADTPAR